MCNPGITLDQGLTLGEHEKNVISSIHLPPVSELHYMPFTYNTSSNKLEFTRFWTDYCNAIYAGLSVYIFASE